jgi:hypothetical protein
MALTPSCYAVTGWRRTDSGRPATNIRLSTAMPMAASVYIVREAHLISLQYIDEENSTPIVTFRATTSIKPSGLPSIIMLLVGKNRCHPDNETGAKLLGTPNGIPHIIGYEFHTPPGFDNPTAGRGAEARRRRVHVRLPHPQRASGLPACSGSALHRSAALVEDVTDISKSFR